MRLFNKGSEWRKWDLHIHAPGTKASDNYEMLNDEPDIDRFCHMLNSSDVQAFGITDYFSLSSFFDVSSRYRELFPNCEKVFFPNLELRLNETVDKNDDHVNLHLIFRPDFPRSKADLFLTKLETELLDGTRNRSCSELTSKADWASAMVTRVAISKALKAALGSRPRIENVLVVAAAGNSGITTNSGKPRTRVLARTLDDLCDGVFGNSRNVDRYLDKDRWETGQSREIPVFGCSDAHSFEELDLLLGKDVDETHGHSEITWIKADLTFEGLQQTVFEPSERVALAPSQPDFKEPFKWIDRVSFSGTGDFPSDVQLNPNLNSIIGSRSSGKSALLAYIAHSVDPAYTEKQQIASGADPKTLGPAAGKSWKSVEGTKCEVHWASPEATDGKVVYIPQNALFTLSDNYEEITAKIRPAIFMYDPPFGEQFKSVETQLVQTNLDIRSSTEDWLSQFSTLQALKADLRELGDQTSVTSTRDHLTGEIASMREASSLTTDEVDKYQTYLGALASRAAELVDIELDLDQLSPYVRQVAGGSYEIVTDAVQIRTTLVPSADDVPEALATEFRHILNAELPAVRIAIETALLEHWKALMNRKGAILALDQSEGIANESLIEKNRSNKELEDLVARHQGLERQLTSIEKQQRSVATGESELEKIGSRLEEQIAHRVTLLTSLEAQFDSKERAFDEMTFEIEIQLDPVNVVGLSAGFNKSQLSEWITNQQIDVARAQASPRQFLQDLATEKQSINRSVTLEQVATQTLMMTPTIRFVAILEDDRIGGFEQSSMTPGKQALFALKLILNESQETWPLLIDQPEDDLDSRSIFQSIVPYLKTRKKGRQIIMVTHNANLAIGADSELVVVANRHGADRKNRNGRMFDYMTGSLEYSKDFTNAATVLARCGIREHACEILDGGAIAFKKRAEKYQI